MYSTMPMLIAIHIWRTFCVIGLAIYETIHVVQCSRWKFWEVIRLNINDTAHYDFKHISIRANIKNSHPHPQFWDEPPAQMVFITWRLASCAKPELILWLWKKIRKSWCACLHIVMFCHGWQNKAASSHGWLVVAGHVTLRKSNSGIPRLFLFSNNGTKITPALRKMPLTNLRNTI